jgi:hypothetical protein
VRGFISVPTTRHTLPVSEDKLLRSVFDLRERNSLQMYHQGAEISMYEHRGNKKFIQNLSMKYLNKRSSGGEKFQDNNKTNLKEFLYDDTVLTLRSLIC